MSQENCGSGRNKRENDSYNNADIFQNAYPISNKQNLHKNTPWIFNQIYIYKSK